MTAPSTSTEAPAAARPGLRPGAPQWAILAIACVGQFMVILDVSVVNVALPSMRLDLHMSTIGLQWVVNAYALTFAGFLLFGGRAADLFGRRRMFLIGLGVFTLASLLGGAAENETWIITARAVQGLGGAVLAPSTLSLLTTTYVEPRERARALGMWGAVAGSGGAVGVLAGGILTDVASWRWVLFVNVPIGVALFAAAAASLAESRGEVRGVRALDLPGTFSVTAALALFVYGIVSTNAYAWGSPHTLASLCTAGLLFVAFIGIELKSRQPMVPLRIFRMRALSAANGIAFFIGAAMFTMFFFLSLYLQVVLSYSPLRTGVAFLPSAIAIVIGAQGSSRLAHRTGPRPLLLSGICFAVGGMIWLSRLTAAGGYWAHIFGPSSLLGLGIGSCMVPLAIAATAGVHGREQGLASGLLNTTRQVGGGLGLAVFTTLAADRTRDLLAGRVTESLAVRAATTSGYDRSLLIAGIVLAAALFLALLTPGHIAPRPAEAGAVLAPAAGH